MTYVLISYDISDDKKRNRVAGLLKDHGKRVQYSVFECHLDADRLNDLVVGLDRFAEGDDSIRVYPICASCLKRAVILGRCESFDEDTYYVV